MEDIRENKPTSTNQIKTDKPSVKKTASVLSGHIAGSMNAGHVIPIQYFETMPGQILNEFKFYGAFKTLTPKSPVFQNATITFYSVFVPHSRVWKNWEKFAAYKGDLETDKINIMPNFGGKKIPVIKGTEEDDQNYIYTNLTNSSQWRDSITSTYIPRIAGNIYTYDELESKSLNITMPEVSALPLRGAIAAWNDIFRDKRYDTELQEYNEDTVSETEWNSYMPNNSSNLVNLYFRAKLPDSYLTNYRTTLQGYEEQPPNTGDDEQLLAWSAWEAKIDFARYTAQCQMENDWNIIADLYGTAPALEGKVQLIGKVTENLNYSAVTQNTYNNNINIDENYRTMGTQGAYSYTQFNGLPLFKNRMFKEAGTVHVFALISVDTVYTSAFDRMDMNVRITDRYRPDLIGDKVDVLYEIENGTAFFQNPTETNKYNKSLGFKRRFSEYFKLRNTIKGDMTREAYFQYQILDYMTPTEITPNEINYNQTITNDTFTFYENNRFYTVTKPILNENEIEFSLTEKQIWKDYSDLTFNKNLAIPQVEASIRYDDYNYNEKYDIIIGGQNQIFYGGICVLNSVLPISEEIKQDFTKWGEH